MKKIFISLLLFISPCVHAKNSFGLMCKYDPWFKEDNPEMKEIYFFSKISRFTGYFLTFNTKNYVNIDGIKVEYESMRNHCKYDGEQKNKYIYSCASNYTGFEVAENAIVIDRESLVMLRSTTTAKYGLSTVKKFSCKTLNEDESKLKLKAFKKEQKDLKKREKEAKKKAKDSLKNKI